MRGGQFQYGGVQPVTPTVKKLLIANVGLWFVLILIVENFFLKDRLITAWFGLRPAQVVQSFWLWQPFTYMFLHSANVFHVLFNMLILWMLGSELETLWGRKFFLFYYLACGIGAGVLYVLGATLYTLATGNPSPMLIPVVGSSGAVFGLMLAYGLIFSERIMVFMFIFPMKARYFVMVIGAIEFLMLMGEGFSSQVANLCHLGGLATGYVILKLLPRIKEYLIRRRTETHGRRLKLVVDNDKSKSPKYWN